jgi:ribosomal protein L40E
MVKFPEATARLFKGKFVCRVCKSAMKAPIMGVLAKEISCRKCGAKVLRPYRKK